MVDQFDAYIIDRPAVAKRLSEAGISASADELMKHDVTAKRREWKICGRLPIKVGEPWRGRISSLMARRFWGG